MKNKNLKNIYQDLTIDRENYINSFRKNLSLYIDRKDVTLNQLAEESGKSFSTLRTFIYGDSKDCYLSLAVEIAFALGISVDELVGCGTLDDDILECIKIFRQLPSHMQELAMWHMKDLKHTTEQHITEKVIKVMLPVCAENGNLKRTENYMDLVITNLDNEWSHKVYLGIKLPCDHYLPHYTRNSILLVANDRNALKSENTLMSVGENIAITRRVIENGVAKHYSIRDGVFRSEESDRVQVLGYIAKVINP